MRAWYYMLFTYAQPRMSGNPEFGSDDKPAYPMTVT